MKIIKTTLLAFLTVLAIASCDSGNDAQIATYNDMIGDWKLTDTEGDVFIQFIYNDGTYSDYDYMGDSFDNLADCYEPWGIDTISDLGGGDFLIDGFLQVRITMSGDTRYISSTLGSATMVPSTLTEAQVNANLCP